MSAEETKSGVLSKGMPSFLFRELLESPPRAIAVAVTDLVLSGVDYNGECKLSAPPVMLHCGHADCQGARLAVCAEKFSLNETHNEIFLRYHCRNCDGFSKIFAIVLGKKEGAWFAIKVGEFPEFTIVTSAKLLNLVGKHRGTFLKGRQCEIHGQGIGAFAYYRRIVELTKDEVLDLVISVAKQTAEHAELVIELESAKKESQFSKAIASVRHALPASLAIEGQNPLNILHSCLSEGIHALSDEECLERATAVREVLSALTERVAELKREQAGLKAALAKLSSRKRA